MRLIPDREIRDLIGRGKSGQEVVAMIMQASGVDDFTTE